MEPSELKQEEKFYTSISEKESRMLKAKTENKRSVWMGLGMLGIIGWSVVVPTLLGVALGIWLDKTYKVSFSWTISFLIIGLVTGCSIAWHWISKERKEMHPKNE